MSLYKQYKTDPVKENDGVNIDFDDIENDDKTFPSFLIARTGPSNKAYTRELENETKPHRRAIELGTFSDTKSKAIFLNVFCKTIIKGWSNVYDEKGKLIEYSVENAKKLMTDLPDVYDRLQKEANQMANFRLASLEAEAGN